jgi:hypothetical protein
LFTKNFTRDKNERIEIKAAPSNETRNLKYLRVKIEGTGECEIYEIEIYMRVKGRTY